MKVFSELKCYMEFISVSQVMFSSMWSFSDPLATVAVFPTSSAGLCASGARTFISHQTQAGAALSRRVRLVITDFTCFILFPLSLMSGRPLQVQATLLWPEEMGVGSGTGGRGESVMWALHSSGIHCYSTGPRLSETSHRVSQGHEVNSWVLESPLESSYTTDRDRTSHSSHTHYPELLSENTHIDLLSRT